MANAVSNSDRETETSVSDESVPLLGLALEDAEAESASIRANEEQKNSPIQARIMEFQGSTALPSIIQAKDAHETTPSSIYMPHILDNDSPFHSTGEGAIIDMMGVEIPLTLFLSPPRGNEPEKQNVHLFRQIALPMIVFFGTFFLIAIVGFSIFFAVVPRIAEASLSNTPTLEVCGAL